MGHLVIYCDGCGSSWNVYHRDDWKGEKARTCPVCGKSIDAQTWERQVLRAFAEMEDVGLELAKDHAQYHNALFTVSYVSDAIFPNRKMTEGIDELREMVEDLSEKIEVLMEPYRDIVETRFSSIYE